MDIIVNGEKRTTASRTIADLLVELKLHERRVAVMVDEQIVRRPEFESHALHAGARVEIISLIGGG